MFQKNILPHFAHKSIFNDAHSSRDNAAQLLISNALSGVQAVAYSPDGRYMVSGSYDNTIRVWDAQTGAQKGEAFTGHTKSVTSVAYSPDGKYIVSVSNDNTVRVWDAQTGAQKGEPLTGHTNCVTSVAYSPDGRYIVSGSWDNTVRVWDAQTGAQKGEPLAGHTNWVESVAYSPDGKCIVSGSWDNTVRMVWDAQTGAQKGEPLTGHTNWVESVAYSPDGKCIVSGSNDNIVRVWDVQESHEEWSSIKDGNVKCQVDNDGWIRSSDGHLIFWVPRDLHNGLQDMSLMCLPKFHPGHPVSLNLANACFGEEWTRVKQNNI
ncbi:WD40 repeat-like protein [Schizopora paradoxa]|uniref:WD40 repeat-like protein n=1 Tax=Schizopora paradoxa TaxID=27342 RepID=A0A0H2RNY1_9AGAM|nr:WD40 repeat-like protein [Schizopora paradoxa]